MGFVKEELLGMAPKEVSHTVEDVFALKGQRAEVFDGEMVVKSFPTTTHQRIVGFLFTEIAVYLRAKEEQSRVLTSPFAVFLKEDGQNYLEPDIAVVCDESKLDEEGCHGAPDWVIEVLSPASRGMDCGKKLGAYIDAGIREYWIVDAEKKVIVAYCFEQPDIPVIYHFGDIIKPSIYKDLMIDSSQLEKIHYKKAVVKASGKSTLSGKEDVLVQQEDVIFAMVAAVKKALEQEGNQVDVPEELIESVIQKEWNAEKAQPKECLAGWEESETGYRKTEYQNKCDVVEEGISKMMFTVEEVKAYIENNYEDLAASRNKGQIMKIVMGALKGRADSKVISEAVAELCK